MGGDFSLKKVLSIILILTILIIPFQTLLNVKAEKVVITTDETKTLEGNTDFKLVKNTTDLIVSSSSNWTSLSAYKVLDVYYNETTNEMTYGFTQKSQEFIDQLPESYDFNTVEDYQKLASGTEFGNSSSETTTLTLNKLVSKYAAYIKNVESVVVTKLNKSDSDNYTANVETGSYLVIPTTSNTYIITEYNELVHSMYAVSVANVIFTVSQGNWELNSASMSLKDSHESTGAAIFNDELDTIVNTGKIKDNSTYSASKDLYFLQCLIIILLTYQLTLMIVF